MMKRVRLCCTRERLMEGGKAAGLMPVHRGFTHLLQQRYMSTEQVVWSMSDINR